MKRKGIIAWALFLILCLSACNTGAPDQSTGDKTTVPAAEKVFRYADIQETGSLNPHIMQLALDNLVFNTNSGALYKEIPTLDGKGIELFPEHAADKPKDVNGDGRVWQIPIREDAAWSNGEPINADTYMYSWKMALDPLMFNRSVTGLANYFIDIENAMDYYLSEQPDSVKVTWEDVGIKKIDDYTIEVRTTQRYSENDVMLHFTQRVTKPVYEPLYEGGMSADRKTTDYGTSLDKFMSSGVYVFDTWVKGSQRVYVKNPNSPLADRIKIDRIEVRIVADSNTRMQMFDNGEIDMLEVDFTIYDRYSGDPRLLEYPSVSIYHYELNRLNPDFPIFKDKEFRQALFYGMDRNTLAKLTAGSPAPFYLHHLAYVDPVNGLKYRDLPEAQALVAPNGGYDPEKAKQLFDSAMERFGLDKLTVEVLIADTSVTHNIIGEYLMDAWPKVFGEDRFEVKLVVVADQQKTATMRAWRDNPKGYAIGTHLFNNSATAYYPALQFRPYTSAYATYTDYDNPEYDALFAKTQTEEVRLDPEKMTQVLLELEAMFLDEVMNIPTVEAVGRMLYSERVILPCEEYLPSVSAVGFGELFADIDLTK